MPRMPASHEIIIKEGFVKDRRQVMEERRITMQAAGDFHNNKATMAIGVGGRTSALFLTSNSSSIHALSLECERATKDLTTNRP